MEAALLVGGGGPEFGKSKKSFSFRNFRAFFSNFIPNVNYDAILYPRVDPPLNP